MLMNSEGNLNKSKGQLKNASHSDVVWRIIPEISAGSADTGEKQGNIQKATSLLRVHPAADVCNPDVSDQPPVLLQTHRPGNAHLPTDKRTTSPCFLPEVSACTRWLANGVTVLKALLVMMLHS